MFGNDLVAQSNIPSKKSSATPYIWSAQSKQWVFNLVFCQLDFCTIVSSTQVCINSTPAHLFIFRAPSSKKTKQIWLENCKFKLCSTLHWSWLTWDRDFHSAEGQQKLGDGDDLICNEAGGKRMMVTFMIICYIMGDDADSQKNDDHWPASMMNHKS